MKKKTKTCFMFAAAHLILFIAFTLLTLKLDVRPIGPQGSEVGFAGLNGWFRDRLPYNETWYRITELLGYLAIASVAGFALIGLTQLIRGGLKGVSYRIWLLGGLYVLLALCYVLFEKTALNFRPVILDEAEGLEASYPSSHTMLVVTCMSATWMQLKWLFKGQPLLQMLGKLVCALMIAVMIIGRLTSGVHWFTDIIGGILLSLFLFQLYNGMESLVSEKMRARRVAAKKRTA